jgi:hypothetical protein
MSVTVNPYYKGEKPTVTTTKSKKILTITVDVEGRSVSRQYFLDSIKDETLMDGLVEMIEVATELESRDF